MAERGARLLVARAFFATVLAWPAPQAAAAGLEDLIFTTQLLGVPTLGFEVAWGLAPAWVVHAGVDRKSVV